MRRRFTSSRVLGLTVVELTIAVAIAALLVGCAGAILSHCLSGWSNGASAACAESQGDLALQKLLFEICDAKTASLNSGVLTVTFPLARQDPTTGEVFYDVNVDGETRQYFLQSGTLMRQVDGNMSVVARNVTSVSFSVTADTVSIALTATECLGRQPVSRQFSGRVVLRNKRSSS